MNKTVSINISGQYFHIDENAYQKLRNYLSAIKKSLQNSQGEDEIMADIESRIAELFSEKIQNNQQVISIEDVDDMIAILGQPEDFKIDQDIFGQEGTASASETQKRQLFRDIDNAYIGGVSSGLGHYFGTDPLWIRLIWILLVFIGGGGVIIYLLLWVLIPAASTTAEKLAMLGKPITINTIEELVKDGFDNVKETIDRVSDKVKDGAYDDFGSKIQSSSRSFFSALGSFIKFLMKSIFKLTGLFIVFTAGILCIEFFISLITIGIVDVFHFPGIDMIDLVNSSGLPIWFISVLVITTTTIPLLFLLLLGLKILNYKSSRIGTFTKAILFGIWMVSIIILLAFGIKQTADFSRNATVIEDIPLQIVKNDTVYIEMRNNSLYSRRINYYNDLKIVYDQNDQKLIYGSNIKLKIKDTKEVTARLHIEKRASADSYRKAERRAENINYGYDIQGQQLLLDSYFTSELQHKIRGQNIEVTLFLPVDSYLYLDKNAYTFIRNSYDRDNLIKRGLVEHLLKMEDNTLLCTDCQ